MQEISVCWFYILQLYYIHWLALVIFLWSSYGFLCRGSSHLQTVRVLLLIQFGFLLFLFLLWLLWPKLPELCWIVAVLHSIYQQIQKTQQWPQNWKRSLFIPIPKKGNAKECSNYCTIALISHASKITLKFSKPGFSNMWTVNFQMFNLILEKAEEPEIKLLNPLDHQKSKRVPEKHLLLLSWLCQSFWLCVSP